MSGSPLHSGERAAHEARRSLGLDELRPVQELLDVVEDLGVPVLVDRFEQPDVAGVLLRRAEGDRFVAVNADHGPVRQRFTLAHELGHIQLGHQPRLDMAADVFDRGRDPQEFEANYFAAEFLAPRLGVLSWLERHDLTRRAGEAVTVAKLALAYGVAYKTACIRLERSGAISSRAKDRLIAELAADGAALARRHGAFRLMDSLETLWRSDDYPRPPRATVAYAQDAHEAGLLDDDELAAIMPGRPALDVSDWFA